MLRYIVKEIVIGSIAHYKIFCFSELVSKTVHSKSWGTEIPMVFQMVLVYYILTFCDVLFFQEK